jgi:alkaline phosphatase
MPSGCSFPWVHKLFLWLAPQSSLRTEQKITSVELEDGPFLVADSDKKFKVDWTTPEHSGVDVPLTAMGPGADQLMGVYENTRIHDVMLRVFKGNLK